MMLHILSTPNFTRQAKLLADLAIAHRLPSMNIFRHYVTAGGLMSYGVETGPMWRRAASYVAKILRGAKPAELPVEQASNFELVLKSSDSQGAGHYAADIDPAARRRGDRVDLLKPCTSFVAVHADGLWPIVAQSHCGGMSAAGETGRAASKEGVRV